MALLRLDHWPLQAALQPKSLRATRFCGIFTCSASHPRMRCSALVSRAETRRSQKNEQLVRCSVVPDEVLLLFPSLLTLQLHSDVDWGVLCIYSRRRDIGPPLPVPAPPPDKIRNSAAKGKLSNFEFSAPTAGRAVTADEKESLARGECPGQRVNTTALRRLQKHRFPRHLTKEDGTSNISLPQASFCCAAVESGCGASHHRSGDSCLAKFHCRILSCRRCWP